MHPVAGYFYVALGGALGASARYGLGVVAEKYTLTLPLGTLGANLLGCFMIGILAQGLATTAGGDTVSRLLLATGFCGGFTTMSSFVLEISYYLRNEQVTQAALYLSMTFIGAFAFFYAGAQIMRIMAR